MPAHTAEFDSTLLSRALVLAFLTRSPFVMLMLLCQEPYHEECHYTTLQLMKWKHIKNDETFKFTFLG